MKLTSKKIFTMVALCSLSTYAAAENYQYEGSVSYADGEAEEGSLSADTEAASIGFTYHFEQVDTSKGPLAEAAFLDRSSSVSVSYSDGEIEDADTDELTASVRIVDKESGLTGELLISDGEIENLDTEALGLSVGYYIAENTEVTLAYADVEVENVDSDSIFVGIKHFEQTGDAAYSVEAAIGSVDNGSDDDAAFLLGGTFYPTAELGIGANYATVDSDIDNDSFEIFADWFVTPTVAVSLSYSDAEVGSVESDSFTIGTRIRF